MLANIVPTNNGRIVAIKVTTEKETKPEEANAIIVTQGPTLRMVIPTAPS